MEPRSRLPGVQPRREGKSAQVPAKPYVQRLHARNEWLIDSHHPLRETIIAQTNATEPQRQAVGKSGPVAEALD